MSNTAYKVVTCTDQAWKSTNIVCPAPETPPAVLPVKKLKGETEIIIDSEIENCLWFGLSLVADISAGASITAVFTTGREDPAGTRDTITGRLPVVWEQTDSIVIGELPDNGLFPLSIKDEAGGTAEPVRGQFLKLKFTLTRETEEVRSPEFRLAMLYFQQTPYIEYLPEFFQDHKEGKSFLDKFLNVFEALFYFSEMKIFTLHHFLDPSTTANDFIPWLAKWLSLDLFKVLELKGKARDFILKAVGFYKQKGSLQCLKELISYITGYRCEVQEYYRSVFRSFSMEQSGPYLADSLYSDKFLSATVDTGNLNLISRMGSYEDGLCYTWGNKDEKEYRRESIGIYIFIPQEKSLYLTEDEINTIIQAFLPVTVRVAHITQILEIEEFLPAFEDSYSDEITGRDSGWSYLIATDPRGTTNDKRYRTVFDGSFKWDSYKDFISLLTPDIFTLLTGDSKGVTNSKNIRTYHTGIYSLNRFHKKGIGVDPAETFILTGRDMILSYERDAIKVTVKDLVTGRTAARELLRTGGAGMKTNDPYFISYFDGTLEWDSYSDTITGPAPDTP